MCLVKVIGILRSVFDVEVRLGIGYRLEKGLKIEEIYLEMVLVVVNAAQTRGVTARFFQFRWLQIVSSKLKQCIHDHTRTVGMEVLGVLGAVVLLILEADAGVFMHDGSAKKAGPSWSLTAAVAPMKRAITAFILYYYFN